MNIHTCSYQCDRPACIRAQRDELAARLGVDEYERGSQECQAAVSAILNHEDLGFGTCAEPWESLRRRLLLLVDISMDRVSNPLASTTPEQDEAKRLAKLRRRVNRARDFPRNTCASSRHLQAIADALAAGRPYPMLHDEPQHCAESIYAVLASLWELRTKMAEAEGGVVGIHGSSLV